MPVFVGDRQVYVCTRRRSQTINICYANNQRGEYEHIIRLFPPFCVSEDEVRRQADILALVDWLKQEKNGKHEKPEPNEAAEQEANVGAGAPDDEWVRQAVFLVEQSIDQLLREFLTVPYSHRVEHSIHARLFAILTGHPHFQQSCPFHGGHFSTQPVHKEWPETKPTEGTRRGNFDLAVLPPNRLIAANPETFRRGLIVAPIAIEIGLDYNFGHLDDDHTKLLHSDVRHGYLLHLTRVGADDDRVTQTIQHPDGNGSIKTAFARIAGEQRFVKFVNEQAIHEWRGF
jgi:hypothetical protein